MKQVSYGIGHGRFQPPHIDHLKYLMSIAMRCDHLIIAITNPVQDTVKFVPESDHRHSAEANPYTYFERAELIRFGLMDMGLDCRSYTIVPFDLFQPKTWRYFLPKSDCMLYLRVFSDWELRKKSIFEENGIPVKILDRPQHKGMAATEVRVRIAKNQSISDFVTPSVEKHLREIHGENNVV
ncbi:MAG: cytidyltransferase [Maricaulis sp.]|jgi:nicotinamide-nucleotide adenylyltransferase|nr:cytidyltransferase [Maricaulis sp.]|tara:strand:- start:1498 stop:2043 length:546 start_codon:yes stop_codon:yes gene_type:complete